MHSFLGLDEANVGALDEGAIQTAGATDVAMVDGDDVGTEAISNGVLDTLAGGAAVGDLNQSRGLLRSSRKGRCSELDRHMVLSFRASDFWVPITSLLPTRDAVRKGRFSYQRGFRLTFLL